MSDETVESNAYGGEPPHVAGSDTSQQAAYRQAPKAATIRAAVLRHFVARFGTGATDEEVQAAMSLGPNTERPRRRELELGGYVVRTRARRKGTSGYWAGVYEVTAEGLAWAGIAADDADLEIER